MQVLLGRASFARFPNRLAVLKVVLPRFRSVRSDWRRARAANTRSRGRTRERTLRANPNWFDEDEDSELSVRSQPTNFRQLTHERVDRKRLWKNKKLKYMNHMLFLAKKGEVRLDVA